MRARDALGRPVPADSPLAVPAVSEEPLPPEQAVPYAQELLDAGRAFSAHEVLEASWKAAPPAERDLWQGLAQVCVGLTHLQRGNTVGAVRLLHRGAGRLEGRPPEHGVDVPAVRAWALRLAQRVEQGAGEPESPLRLG
ncbi:MAG: aromatic ring-opening dioxygenase LigA [Frankiales bacterium]|nr:aromatic ring-opening dioxygenase LigA [Frankiales bacterium]